MKIKNLFIYFLTLSFILLNINYSCIKIFAQSKDYYPTSYTKIYTEKEDSNRIINGVPISITAREDGTGVDVYVGNIGVDGLDRVEVKVRATGYSNSKTQVAYVIPVVGKTFNFDFPMIKANTSYYVNVTIYDGNQVKTKSGEANLVFSEQALSNANWNKGTFSTRAESLEYHFEKHGDEVNSANLVYYLNKANDYRSEVINDINSNNVSKYKITNGTGNIPSKKYKNNYDSRFIILSNNGYDILSFGK